MLHSEKHIDTVALLMESLIINTVNAYGPTQRPRNGPDRSRISSLDPEHSLIVGNCLVFRISLGMFYQFLPNENTLLTAMTYSQTQSVLGPRPYGTTS